MNIDNNLSKDILVKISFLLEKNGGRKNPVYSGYRPQYFYYNNDWDSIHTYLDKEKVFPGENVEAIITFTSPQSHVGNICEGDHFLVREGNKTIAYGHVIKLLELEKHAKEVEEEKKKIAQQPLQPYKSFVMVLARRLSKNHAKPCGRGFEG